MSSFLNEQGSSSSSTMPKAPPKLTRQLTSNFDDLDDEGMAEFVRRKSSAGDMGGFAIRG